MKFISRILDSMGDWMMTHPMKTAALLIILVCVAANTHSTPTSEPLRYEQVIGANNCPVLVEPTVQYVVDGKLQTITTIEYAQYIAAENAELKERVKHLEDKDREHQSTYNDLQRVNRADKNDADLRIERLTYDYNIKLEHQRVQCRIDVDSNNNQANAKLQDVIRSCKGAS